MRRRRGFFLSSRRPAHEATHLPSPLEYWLCPGGRASVVRLQSCRVTTGRNAATRSNDLRSEDAVATGRLRVCRPDARLSRGRSTCPRDRHSVKAKLQRRRNGHARAIPVHHRRRTVPNRFTARARHGCFRGCEARSGTTQRCAPQAARRGHRRKSQGLRRCRRSRAHCRRGSETGACATRRSEAEPRLHPSGSADHGHHRSRRTQ